MRRSAAALLARPPPPPPPPPLGLEAVQAAAAEAVRAAERKFAAVRAAVPSLVLAAPALLPARRALLSPAFAASGPALPASSAPVLPRARSGSDLQAWPAGLAIRSGGRGSDGGPAGAGRDEPLASPRGAGPMLRRPFPPADGSLGGPRGPRRCDAGGGRVTGEDGARARAELGWAAARRFSFSGISG